MNAEQLAASIIADAKKRAHNLERESMQAVHAYEDETSHILSEKKEKAISSVHKHEQEEHQRLEAQAHRSAALALLQARQHELDTVFEEASHRLSGMSGQERTHLLDHLWKKAKSQIDVGSVVVAEQDKPFFSRKAKAATQQGLGGFTAVSKDGLVSVDMTFETLLESVRTNNLQEVAAQLFRE